MNDFRAYQNRLEQLRLGLLAKAPFERYLTYTKLDIEITNDEVRYRVSAALWRPPSAPSIFEFYESCESPEAGLNALQNAIRDFEIWTPEAIAATLGIAEAS